MTTPFSAQTRIRGSIYGVAIVDALGGPAEFQQRGTFPLIEGFQVNENFGLSPGTWTDDTSMTLCLGKSLIVHHPPCSPLDVVRRWISWYRQGYMSAIGRCFDIGNATRQALTLWEKTLFKARENGLKDEEALLSMGQVAIDRELKRETCCGNGALMRTAPIALALHGHQENMERCTIVVAGLTHPHSLNAIACVLYSRLMLCALRGETKANMVEIVVEFVKTSCESIEATPLKDRLLQYDSLVAFDVDTRDISSSGYVVDTLEAALWAFFTTSTFKEGALRVVNLGDDADTVGAVYGGLAGAFYGEEGIPTEWIEGLRGREMVEGVANGLAQLNLDGHELVIDSI